MKVKKIERLSVREDTGCLTIKDPGSNHNFAVKAGIFVKNSADGRGSSVDSVGGNSAGFTELDDIYYFSRKLYRALKYPLSRVTAEEEKRSADILFGGNQTSEISRDEIKWAKFLERQQNRVCRDLRNIFLLHMDFKNLKEQYGLNKENIELVLNPPSHYKEQMEQNFLQSRFDNYNTISDKPEISKYFCMKKYLNWDDDTIQDNIDGLKKDKELGLVADEGSGGGRW